MFLCIGVAKASVALGVSIRSFRLIHDYSVSNIFKDLAKFLDRERRTWLNAPICILWLGAGAVKGAVSLRLLGGPELFPHCTLLRCLRRHCGLWEFSGGAADLHSGETSTCREFSAPVSKIFFSATRFEPPIFHSSDSLASLASWIPSDEKRSSSGYLGELGQGGERNHHGSDPAYPIPGAPAGIMGRKIDILGRVFGRKPICTRCWFIAVNEWPPSRPYLLTAAGSLVGTRIARPASPLLWCWNRSAR